jgi:DNA-binding response OmpR family regulator
MEAVRGRPHMPENNRTRILVVEDEALIGLVFEQFLRDYGYSVIGPIENLKAAEFLAATEEIDAAVIDVNISGETATTVADKLIARKIPFLFVSGYDRMLGLRYATIPFLPKPFSPEELNFKLDELLRLPGSKKKKCAKATKPNNSI